MSVESKKEQEGIIEVLKQFPDEIRKLQAMFKVHTAALAASSTGQNRGVVRIAGALAPITVTQAPFGGRIILWDDVEATAVNWRSGGANAGANNATRYTTTPNVYRGAGALLIETSSTTPLVNQVANASREVCLGKARKIKIEAKWREVSSADVLYVTFSFYSYDGVNVSLPSVRYDTANLKWQYLNVSGTWTDVTGGLLTQVIDPGKYHNVTLSFDISTQLFIELEADGIVWDARSISYRYAASANAGYNAMQIDVQNAGSAQSQIVVDDILITDISESV